MAAPSQVFDSIARLVGPRTQPEVINRVWDQVENLEQKYDVHLTEVAKALLTLPVVERAAVGLRIDAVEVDATLDTLFKTMMGKGPDAVGLQQPMAPGDRGSLAVIEAWAENFCKIPPFCGRT